MTEMAWHDSLTGLANRSLFMVRMQQAMQKHTTQGGQFAVLFCDLDGFKRINDLFGHAAGDELLGRVGARIKAAIRTEDTVARLGGDEFAVLVENVTSPDDVDATCQRILESLRARVQLTTEEVSISTTIGVAMSATGRSADSLLSQADLAMYHAKRHGKNRYETYHLALGEERRRRIELVENLRRAIDSRELEVFYQPIVKLSTREISGVEALVRWRRDGELISPKLFIPVAEESGLIVGLDQLVLDLVVAQVPHLRAAAGRQIIISVNISGQHLQSDDLRARVRTARQEMGDVNLVLEMTERDFVDSDRTTLAAMEALANENIRFAIDDFGVGFSSFSYLQRLPVSILKLDQSFVEGIERDEKARTLVRSVIVMADALGIDVVIEGIERESQLYHLDSCARACSGQGYFFAKPIPFDEMVAILRVAASQVTPRIGGTTILT
ncbi:MAG: EAL domain-containing protein [Nocardioidaceae bacterium]|nr:EAL domain-containing protein [Nocardioidaceae bacterium]